MHLLEIPLIGDTIKTGFLGIGLFIDGGIFSLISSAFKIFMALASARFFTNDMYKDIAYSIYFIVGVAMLFVLSYAIVKGIIDPDKLSKEKMGGPKMVGNIITAVVGLAITPFVFNLLYQAQGIIVDNHIIENIIFRDYDEVTFTYTEYGNKDENGNSSTTTKEQTQQLNDMYNQIGGSYTAAQTWKSLFRPAESALNDANKDGVISEQEYMDSAEAIVGDPSAYYKKSGDFWTAIGIGLAAVTAVVGYATSWTGVGFFVGCAATAAATGLAGYNYANAIENIGKEMTLLEAYTFSGSTGQFGIFQIFAEVMADEGTIEYNFLVTTICGLFILYSFVSFSIDMGTRAAKLAYYQIIAPVPLIMKVIPTYEKNFQNYVKSVISTFLEVIVRILVIYIVVYLICHLGELFKNMQFEKSLSITEQNFAMAFLIIGLILFAKKAPELITSSLGIKPGDLHFGIREKLARGEVFTAGAALGGLATSGVRGFRNSWAHSKTYNRRVYDPKTKKWNTETRNSSFARRAAMTAMGTVGSAGGSLTRSARDRYRAGKDGYLKDAHAMRDTAGRNAAEVDKTRQARYDYAAEHPDGTLKARMQDVRSNLRTWSTGAVDDSAMQAQSKYVSEMKSTYNRMKDTVGNEDDVKSVRRELQNAEYGGLAEFTRRKKIEEEVLREYNKKHGTNFKDMTELNKSGIESDIDALTKSANENWSSLKYNPTERDMSQYEAAYNDTLNRLQKKEKDTVAAAIGRRMTEAASGIDNDTSRMWSEFVRTHQAEAYRFRDIDLGAQFGESEGGNIEAVLRGNYGQLAVDKGVADYVHLTQRSLKPGEMYVAEYVDNNDHYMGTMSIKKDGSGNITYRFVDENGHDITDINGTVDASDYERVAQVVHNRRTKKANVFVVKEDQVKENDTEYTYENSAGKTVTVGVGEYIFVDENGNPVDLSSGVEKNASISDEKKKFKVTKGGAKNTVARDMGDQGEQSADELHYSDRWVDAQGRKAAEDKSKGSKDGKK